MFARAGALNPEGQQIGVFAEHRDQILETAKKLVDDTKRLVSSAASSQEQLAAAAHQAVRTITQEAEHVKLGASVLTGDDVGAQVSVQWSCGVMCINWSMPLPSAVVAGCGEGCGQLSRGPHQLHSYCCWQECTGSSHGAAEDIG